MSFSEFLSFCTFPKDELEDVATRLQDKRVFGDPNDDQNYAYFVKKSTVGWVAVARAVHARMRARGVRTVCVCRMGGGLVGAVTCCEVSG